MEKKIRALINQRLTNEEESDTKTYQNTQIYYEKGVMGEDYARRLPRILLVHYMLEDFREDFHGNLPKLGSDLKNSHIQNHSSGFKTKKNFKIR